VRSWGGLIVLLGWALILAVNILSMSSGVGHRMDVEFQSHCCGGEYQLREVGCNGGGCTAHGCPAPKDDTRCSGHGSWELDPFCRSILPGSSPLASECSEIFDQAACNPLISIIIIIINGSIAFLTWLSSSSLSSSSLPLGDYRVKGELERV